MSWRLLRRAAGTVLVLGLLTCSSVAAQEHVFVQPVDPRDRVNALDQEVLVKQRELFAARQRGDQEAVKKLSKDFKAIQRDRYQAIQKAKNVE